MIYFISGHRDLSYEDFEKYYIPIIKRVILEDEDAEFIVGDCEGVDKFAMDYIFNIRDYIGYIIKGKFKLTIYHMFQNPRNIPDSCVPGISENVNFIGGFQSDIERDSAMTRDSDYDIAFIKDDRWNSGTAQNIKRRHGIY